MHCRANYLFLVRLQFSNFFPDILQHAKIERLAQLISPSRTFLGAVRIEELATIVDMGYEIGRNAVLIFPEAFVGNYCSEQIIQVVQF